MSRALNGPIPGQSLTDEPSNYAWERPPETADPTEALSMHLKKMAGPKYMDSAIYMMELGVPADVITNTTLTMAIGNGIHSVDVGLIIAPAIHKEVVSIAEMAGIEYDEHFPEDAEKEQEAKERLKTLVISKMKRNQPEGKAQISQTMEAMTSPQTEEFEDMQEQDEPMDMAQSEEPQEPPTSEETGMGLMSREHKRMGINLNVLSAISGAAEQYTKQTSELKKELRENKRRQRDWLATYGSKALNENKQQQESVQSALDDLKARGLDTPDAIQLLQKHGVGSVLELSKYVKEYEVANNTKVDKDLMDKLWTAADDFTTTETTFEAAVAKVFGTSAGAATAPVIQEAEDRNFFEQLKYNMGERYDDELEDFLTDASEGIGGKSIRELRAMSASSPSMLGTEGSAVFDRSALRGSESTSAERASWNDLKETILYNALESLDSSVAENIRLAPADTDTGVVSRNSDEQWNILTSMNAPEAYKEAIAEATRNAAQGIDLGSNRAAWNSYGGQDALNAILNPLIALKEQLAENGLSDEDSQLIVDNPFVKTGNEQEDLAKVREFLEANPNLPYVIIDNKIMEAEGFLNMTEEGGGDEEGSTDTPPPTEGIPTRPVPRYTGGEKTRPLQKPINHRDIKDWDKQYGDRYNPDATPIIVEPRPVLPETFDEAVFDTPKKIREERGRINNEIIKWNRQYKKTHDPVTGNPLPFWE